MLITKQMLTNLNTQGARVDAFIKTWPNGMEVNLKNCLQLLDVTHDIGWMAKLLLPPSALEKYQGLIKSAWEAYEKSIIHEEKSHSRLRENVKNSLEIDESQIEVEYRKALAPALETYRQDSESVEAWEACWKIIARAQEIYQRDIIQARKRFQSISSQIRDIENYNLSQTLKAYKRSESQAFCEAIKGVISA